jgi:hypothetical protein
MKLPLILASGDGLLSLMFSVSAAIVGVLCLASALVMCFRESIGNKPIIVLSCVGLLFLVAAGVVWKFEFLPIIRPR